MVNFMAKNNGILNLHEQKFAKLDVFKANTNVFQEKTNASLKNLVTQMGQLAQTLKNQSKDSFPSDTKKIPKDFVEITLRSGKELQVRREAKKRQSNNEAESENHNQESSEKRHEKIELTNESQ